MAAPTELRIGCSALGGPESCLIGGIDEYGKEDEAAADETT